MNERYQYIISADGDWETLYDTVTNTRIEGHKLNVDDVFFFLGIGKQLKIVYEEEEEE